MFYIFLVFLTFSFFFYLYICQKNLENTFCGAILIVSRQYGWKMFRSSFDDFSGLGAFKGRKVENGAKMTQFSARNIPTLFEVKFLSFPINTAKKCFGWILTTKVENRARMTRFCTQNIPTLFEVQFLSFPISKDEKCFGRMLTTIWGLGTIEAGKVENGAQMTRFSAQNIPTLFRVHFLLFHISMAEKYFTRILTTFLDPNTTGGSKVEN